MTIDELHVEPGDWFVHAHFGIGQLHGQEVKRVAGHQQTYYEMRTIDCTLWLSVGQIDGHKIRPLANPDEFQQVIELLERPSKEMSPEANKRKVRIKAVRSANTPLDTARLVRDLWARQRDEGKLYDWERQAWRESSTILLQEWALCLGISPEQARRQLAMTLRKGQARSAASSPAETSALLDSLINDEKEWDAWLDEVTA